jgi:hypothetical protein
MKADTLIEAVLVNKGGYVSRAKNYICVLRRSVPQYLFYMEFKAG